MRPSSTTPHGSVMLDSDPDDLPTSEEEDLQPSEQVQFPSTVSMTDTTSGPFLLCFPYTWEQTQMTYPRTMSRRFLLPNGHNPVLWSLTHPQAAAAQAQCVHYWMTCLQMMTSQNTTGLGKQGWLAP